MKILHKESNVDSVYHSITTHKAQWKDLNFEARIIKKSSIWKSNTKNNEYVIVLLSGNLVIHTSDGDFFTKNGRKDVFSGIGHALYLSPNTDFEITSLTDISDIAYAWAISNSKKKSCMVYPKDVSIEIRGGDNATRQINNFIPEGFGNDRLVACEVYTPSGNWSSFPAHKHDEVKKDSNGKVVETRLEEVYFYKFQKPEAYAIQQVYTKDGILDEIIRPKHNDVVLVPKGYHPVVAEHGYHCYYLNFLAGDHQTYASSFDSDHLWILNSWKEKDKRLPLVNAEMNNQTNKL